MPKPFRRTIAAAMLAAAMLALPALPARAADDPTIEEGPKKVVQYSTCAGSLALATNLYTAYVAFMGCLKLFVEEMAAQ